MKNYKQQVKTLIAKVQNMLSGSKLFTLHYSLFTLLAFVSCKDDVDNVFGDSSANRIAKQQSEYAALLESQELGWALDFYPADGIEGGVAYTARFKDGVVTMTCEQDIYNTVVSRRMPRGTQVSSSYQVLPETGVMLTFNTYNPLFHYWSQPFKGHAKGYESDYEFTFLTACADLVVLRGKKHGNVLCMYPLKQSDTDYVGQVAAMRKTLEAINRKRAVVDGQTLPITMAYDLLTYEADGQTHQEPFIHTPEGIRFYRTVTLGDASVNQLTYDATTQELRSADGRVVLPKPTVIEQDFIATKRQWTFGYKYSLLNRNYTLSDMCDDLAAIITDCVAPINGGSWGETVRDIYLGANMESFANDRHRWVAGWHTVVSGSIDFFVGYAVDIEQIDADRQLVSIRMTEPASLFSNYGYWQPFVDFVGQHSPYLVQFNNPSAPTQATLTSEKDASKWFILKRK
jgi:hypothetical protein